MLNPALKVLLRGGGKGEHDTLKALGFLWTLDGGAVFADFEIGGFDVLGIYPDERRKRGEPPAALDRRVVIDAKTSMSDLLNHFKKDRVRDCDIEGKFSVYGNRHYILAKKGVIKPDAVHDPWGLLEVTDGKAPEITKEACARAYIGEGDEVSEIARRFTALMRSFVKDPGKLSTLKEQLPEEARRLIRDEDGGRRYVESVQSQLVKLSSAFEVLYGYHPLR